MSDATTALAEVLNRHSESRSGHDAKADQIVTVCACGDEVGRDLKSYDLRHRAIEAHQAAAVVAAVRGLSPDLQAELIGGEATTEWAIKWDQNDVDFPFLSRSAAASVAVREHLDDEDTYRIESRSVIRGPWTPEPSEETP